MWAKILPRHHNIKHIRNNLSKTNTESLVHTFITSRLDYCNSQLYELPKYQLFKLQRVMNDSAHLVYCAPKSCHITPLLSELYWLSVCFRIEYKLILLLTFKVLHGMAPDLLSALFSLRSTSFRFIIISLTCNVYFPPHQNPESKCSSTSLLE